MNNEKDSIKLTRIDNKGRITISPEYSGEYFQVEKVDNGWLVSPAVFTPVENIINHNQ